MMKKAFILTFVSFLCGCASLESKQVHSEAAAELSNLINKAKRADFIDYLMEDKIQPLCLDAGEEAIPLLIQYLDVTNAVQDDIAIVGLAYIGGDKAVSALKKHYERTKSDYVRQWLCFAMASTKSPKDIDFLMGSLLDEKSEWQTLANASLALGVRRAKEALPFLSQNTKIHPNAISSACAKAAMQWINQGAYKANISPSSETEKILVAILKNGLKLRNENEDIYQKSPRRKFVYGALGWEIQAGPNGDGFFPEMSRFDVHYSPDNKRALCRITISYGIMASQDFHYTLFKRTDGTWQVVGIILNAMS